MLCLCGEPRGTRVLSISANSDVPHKHSQLTPHNVGGCDNICKMIYTLQTSTKKETHHFLGGKGGYDNKKE